MQNRSDRGAPRVQLRGMWGGATFVAALLAACAQGSPQPDDGVLGVTTEALAPQSFALGGQKLDVRELGTMPSNTSHIAACGDGVVYATHTDSSLWVNLNVKGDPTRVQPNAWQQVTAASPGLKIACDHSHLYAINPQGGQNTLWYVRTAPNGQLPLPAGQLIAWSQTPGGTQLGLPAPLASAPPGTVDIQSGNGNIYALFQQSNGTSALFASPLNDQLHPTRQGTSGSWIQLASNLGSKLATGSGSTGLLVPENRAFGMNPNGTLFFNDKMLALQNLWSSFPNGGYALTSISAESASLMYGIGTSPRDSTVRLVQYKFSEANCVDGLDSDQNGLADADDPACQTQMAANYCSTHADGDYCLDRLKAGAENARVTCKSGQSPVITAGVCSHGAILGLDTLPIAQNPEPPSMGHYCNTIAADNTWGFGYTGATTLATSCADLQLAAAAVPITTTVVRAGLFSKTGTNDVLARCNNGTTLLSGVGAQPLLDTYNGLGHTANACVITVSPRQMPVFKAPFPPSTWAVGATNRGYRLGHVFDHSQPCNTGDTACTSVCPGGLCSFNLSSFGTGPGSTVDLNNKGQAIPAQVNQSGYDFLLTEGTPLLAMANGTVIDAGSRGRDISQLSNAGTTYQNEVMIRYDIGTDAMYQESFVAYHAHLSQRLVQSGQTVKAGQVIGYVGMSGAASEPHVHFALTRLSNVNATKAGMPQLGRMINTFASNLNSGTGVNPSGNVGLVDPYGWRSGGFDPWGYFFARMDNSTGSTGMGAWSPTVWSPSETPPF
jgi:hypothetical protein